MGAQVPRHRDLTQRILAAAIEVHRVLGPGYVESVYEQACAREFDLRGIRYERQKQILVPYKDVIAGEHRLDFLVEDHVIVELKTVSDFDNIHLAQILSYLKAMGKHTGLLINFAKPRLMQGVKRVAL